MKDMVGIIAIVFYWFILAIMLTYIGQDPSLQQIEASSGNLNNSIIGDISQMNVTDSGETTNFIGMAGRMLTFRIPEDSSFPDVIISFIEVTNFLLVIILGILLYRQIRSGAG